MNRTKNLISKIFFNLLSVEEMEKQLANLKIEKHLKRLNMPDSSKLYEEARVDNFQNESNMIIVGNNTHIRGKLLVFAYGGSITIGDNCYVGENSNIWSGDRIDIGNNVLISHNVNIIDSNSHEINHKERARGYLSLLTSGHPKEKGNIITSPIRIEDFAWINFNAIIVKGVRIGKGAIVASGSVVTRDVPPFTLVAGNPATEKKKLKGD